MTLTMASSRIAFPIRRSWPLFVVLSLLIHLVLLVLLARIAPARLQQGENTIAPLAVQIEPASRGNKAAVQKPATNETPASTASTSPREAIAQSTADAAVKNTLQSNNASPNRYDERMLGTSYRLLDSAPDAGRAMVSETSDKQSDDETRLHIESLIRTRFSEHFIYPLMAQRYGWQGEVLLSFRVSSDGTITTVEVVRGSGHAVLDQAALDSMRAIKRIEFTPGTTLRHKLELHMPVIYHLAQG